MVEHLVLVLVGAARGTIHHMSAYGRDNLLLMVVLVAAATVSGWALERWPFLRAPERDPDDMQDWP